MKNIIFVTKNNNNFYRLELSKTLTNFVEFDFTYFWEQCIELGKASRVVGGTSTKQLQIIKNLILKCHPYFDAQSNSDFDSIVLDCIIEYICHSENIGLQELWTRCISPKNLYEKAIFSRISEYKTNRAINQWANIMRCQEYSKIKLDYIFDGKRSSSATYKARKGYFDLTFSVAAKELGFPSSELPSVRSYNPSLIPNAPFILSKVSKGILRRICHIVEQAVEPSYSTVKDVMRDQISLDAFKYIKAIPRPQDADFISAVESFGLLADEVFMPDGFKAIIDLEIDKMLEREIFMQRCKQCNRYFQIDDSYPGEYCKRVSTSGKTCREENVIKEPDIPVVADLIPLTLQVRSDKIFTSLNKRVSEDFDEKEFKEWAQYLLNMRKNIEDGYSTVEDLEAFLDYSERLYGEVNKEGFGKIPPIATPQVSLHPAPVEKKPVKDTPEPIHVIKANADEPVKYKFPTLAELENFDDDKEKKLDPPKYRFPTLDELPPLSMKQDDLDLDDQDSNW